MVFIVELLNKGLVVSGGEGLGFRWSYCRIA